MTLFCVYLQEIYCYYQRYYYYYYNYNYNYHTVYATAISVLIIQLLYNCLTVFSTEDGLNSVLYTNIHYRRYSAYAPVMVMPLVKRLCRYKWDACDTGDRDESSCAGGGSLGPTP